MPPQRGKSTSASAPCRIEYAGYSAATYALIEAVSGDVTVVAKHRDMEKRRVDGKKKGDPPTWELMPRDGAKTFHLRQIELYLDDHDDAEGRYDDGFATMMQKMLFPGIHMHAAVQQKHGEYVQQMLESWVEVEELGDAEENEEDDAQSPSSDGQKATLFVLYSSFHEDTLSVEQVDRHRDVFLKELCQLIDDERRRRQEEKEALEAEEIDEDEEKPQRASAHGTKQRQKTQKPTLTIPRWSDKEVSELLVMGTSVVSAACAWEDARVQRLRQRQRRQENARGDDFDDDSEDDDDGDELFRLLPFSATNILCADTATYFEDCEELYNEIQDMIDDPDADLERVVIKVPRIQEFFLSGEAFVSVGIADATEHSSWTPLHAILKPSGDIFSEGQHGASFLLGATLLELALAIPPKELDIKCTGWKHIMSLKGTSDCTTDDGRHIMPVSQDTVRIVYNAVFRALVVQMVNRSVQSRPTPAQAMETIKAFSNKLLDDPEADENQVVLPATKKEQSKSPRIPHPPRPEPTRNNNKSSSTRQTNDQAAANSNTSTPRRTHGTTPKNQSTSSSKKAPSRKTFVAQQRKSIRQVLSKAAASMCEPVPRSSAHVGAHSHHYSARTTGPRPSVAPGKIPVPPKL